MSRKRLSLVLLFLFSFLAGCFTPTAKNIEGLVLNSVAWVYIVKVNNKSYKNRGHGDFIHKATVNVVDEVIKASIDSVNVLYTFPSFTFHKNSVSRRNVPLEQKTPFPVFQILKKSISSDSLFYILLYRGRKKIYLRAFSLGEGGVKVEVRPYKPSKGLFLMQRSDQMQRQALEQFYETFLLMLDRKGFEVESVNHI